MQKQKLLINAKGEVRELTANDLTAFRPARKALPESLRLYRTVPDQQLFQIVRSPRMIIGGRK